jgi:hypothetical protein
VQLVRHSALVFLLSAVLTGCAGQEADNDDSTYRAQAARVGQTIEQAFRRIGASTTTAELEAAVEELQTSADELALDLDRTDAPSSAMQDKQALSSMLRDLSGRLNDVEAHVSQTPDIDAALQGEALVMLEPLRHKIKALAADLQDS